MRRNKSEAETPNAAQPYATEPPVPANRSNYSAGTRPINDEEKGKEIERTKDPPDRIVELAIAHALEDAEAELRIAATAVPEPLPMSEPAPPIVSDEELTRLGSPSPSPSATATTAARAPREPSLSGSRTAPTGERQAATPLLSPKTETMVSATFNQLATTMVLSGSARTLDDLVEEMLRPMLRTWLDLNLH